MAGVDPGPPVQVGDRAPDFTLPAVHREGTVSLGDYCGRSPVLLALERGVYCPFCRRHIAFLDTTREKLRALGVETLAIVATTLERSRLYFRFHPTRLSMAADPEMATHRSYGLPSRPVTPELIRARREMRDCPVGELPDRIPSIFPDGSTFHDVYNRLDGFEPIETDRADMQRQFSQFSTRVGQFLVDGDGIIRWASVGARAVGTIGGRAGKLPTDDEILAAARDLVGSPARARGPDEDSPGRSVDLPPS